MIIKRGDKVDQENKNTEQEEKKNYMPHLQREIDEDDDGWGDDWEDEIYE